MPGDQRRATVRALAVDQRLPGLAVQGGRELFFDDRGLVLDDQYLVDPVGHGAQGRRAERPGQVDLDQTQTEVVPSRCAKPEIAQGTQCGGVRRPRGEDGEPGTAGLAGDAVEAGQLGVGVHPGDALAEQVLLDLERARPQEGPWMPGPGLVRERDPELSEGREGDGGTGIGDVSHDLHGAPQARVTRERHGVQPQREDVGDRGGGEDGHAQRPGGELARAGQGGGLAQGIVPHQRHRTAERGGARHVGVTDGVGRPVQAGILPVPEADHPVDPPAVQLADELGPADRRRGQLLVQPRGEDDLGPGQQVVGALELLIEAAQRRPFVATDEQSGREVAQAVEASLCEQESHHRFHAREQNRPLGCVVAVVQADGACRPASPRGPRRRAGTPLCHFGNRRHGHIESEHPESPSRRKFLPIRCLTQWRQV